MAAVILSEAKNPGSCGFDEPIDFYLHNFPSNHLSFYRRELQLGRRSLYPISGACQRTTEENSSLFTLEKHSSMTRLIFRLGSYLFAIV